MVEQGADTSILASIAKLLVPVMQPVSLGNWKIITSLISGFMAKESVVSIMEILFPNGGVQALGSLTGLTILAFSLLYTPCIAAIASIRRELGRTWAVGVVLWQCGIAWIAALLVRLIGLALGAGPG